MSALGRLLREVLWDAEPGRVRLWVPMVLAAVASTGLGLWLGDWTS